MNGSQLARVGMGAVTALLAMAIVLLVVRGEELHIPGNVFSTAMLVLPGLWALFLKQGQIQTQKKLDQLLDQAEASGFERGVRWAHSHPEGGQ